MWIKICGNTNLEDARLAADLGADALGFIFAPSKRRVTPEIVSAIIPKLPSGIDRVGVFQGHTAPEIATVVRQTGLNAVQLHDPLPDPRWATLDPSGHRPASASATPDRPDPFSLARDLQGLLGEGVRVIQALHWTVPSPSAIDLSPDQAASFEQTLQRIAAIPTLDYVLVDSRVGNASGGTGVAFDWSAARSALARIPERLSLIVAGGLNPENVAGAIRVLQPWGVDAVSGVEAAPGRKDPRKLAAFLKNARAL